jgi:hypothetical protein
MIASPACASFAILPIPYHNQTAAANKTFGSVLIWRGARIVPNPQRLDDAEMLRVGTTRAPVAGLKFKFGHRQTFPAA